MGMSGHVSASPLRACVKVDDSCDPFFAGTLTYVKTIEMCVESICHQMHAIHNSRLLSFVLVWTIRSCAHIIQLPNIVSKMAILKIIILVGSETISELQTR
jgi:hypothetical protein